MPHLIIIILHILTKINTIMKLLFTFLLREAWPQREASVGGDSEIRRFITFTAYITFILGGKPHCDVYWKRLLRGNKQVNAKVRALNADPC